MSVSHVKIDLNVRSRNSSRVLGRILSRARGNDRGVTPGAVYDMAMARGMSLVTLTDRDQITGAVELAKRYPTKAFISAQVSARFPEDGCVMFVNVLDISEAQHREIQSLRRDIYELVRYLDARKIESVLCHPLLPVNQRLDRTHVQRALLMFKNLELRNGACDAVHERTLARIVAGMTPERAAAWAQEFPQAPFINHEARFALVGGSGDDTGVRAGDVFTTFEGEPTVAGFIAALRSRSVAPGGGIAPAASIETQRSAEDDRTALADLGDALAAKPPGDVAQGLTELLKAVLPGLPQLYAVRKQARDRRAVKAFATRLGFDDRGKMPKVAIISESVDHVDGLSLGLRRLAKSARSQGYDVHLVGPGTSDKVVVDSEGVIRVPVLMTHAFPDYPEYRFSVPHIPSLLAWLQDAGVDLVQCSTPGTMGVSGLIAGRMAGLPVIGQYHTDVPEYITRIMGDKVVAALGTKLVGWFYNAVDEVLVPSEAVVRVLGQLGVPAHRTRHVPRGIDLSLFTPSRRDPKAFAPFGLNGEPKVLYVGRLSREKGLDALLDGFREVGDDVRSAKLLMVGDGPYAPALARKAKSDRVIFTGQQMGETLASMYASSDVFVCPSETETFGNTVVEAQAAGVPVIVSNRGAAQENVVDGVTGLVVDVQKPGEIRAAIVRLLSQPELRARMSKAAVEWSRRYDVHESARGTYDIYREVVAADRPRSVSPDTSS